VDYFHFAKKMGCKGNCFTEKNPKPERAGALADSPAVRAHVRLKARSADGATGR
jgi:hypothetical protein